VGLFRMCAHKLFSVIYIFMIINFI